MMLPYQPEEIKERQGSRKMIKVTFDFYVNGYGGKIISDELEFKQPVLKANTYLNNLMHREPQADTLELVQMCLCEVAEVIYQEDCRKAEHDGREVQSENTDGYSVTYATEAEAGKNATNSLQKKAYAIIRRCLSHIGLLYAGVNCNAHKCSYYDF